MQVGQADDAFPFVTEPRTTEPRLSFDHASVGGTLDLTYAELFGLLQLTWLASPSISLESAQFGSGSSISLADFTAGALSIRPAELKRYLSADSEQRLAALRVVEATAKANGDLGRANQAHFQMQVLESADDPLPQRIADAVFYRSVAGYFVQPLRPVAWLLGLIFVAAMLRAAANGEGKPPVAEKRKRTASEPDPPTDGLGTVARTASRYREEVRPGSCLFGHARRHDAAAAASRAHRLCRSARVFHAGTRKHQPDPSADGRRAPVTMLGRNVVRFVVAVFLLAALAGALLADAPQSRAASVCSSPVGRGAVAGALIQVLHSSVFVGGRYVGAAPFDIRSGAGICTDSRGQVVFELKSSPASTSCIVLPRSSLVVSSALVIHGGTSWCVVRGGTARFGIRGGRTLSVSKDTLFGVAVDDKAVVVKVVAGAVDAGRTRIAGPRQARLIREWSREKLARTAEDRVAIAQLSTAIARQP